MTRIELAAGETRLTLAPEIGGGVAGFSWRGHDIFRRADLDLLEAQGPLGLANFPLVPFAGRVDQGRFSFNGRDIVLPPDLPGEAHAIHGQGWMRPWAVAEVGADHTTLRLVHSAGAWPWAYEALQVFHLTDRGLIHTLGVTNLDNRPMPVGLGLHPYFPRSSDTRLQAAVTGYVPNDAQMRPLPETQPPADRDWSSGPPIPHFVDNQFTGWDGRARLSWPSRGLALDIMVEPAVKYLVVYAPTGQNFLCVEPVSHRLGGLNQGDGGAGSGMNLLPPGETLRLCVRFEVIDLGS